MSDAALVEKFIHTSDSQWMGVLLQRYTLLLFGVCMKYLKNKQDAQDAVQQIFLKVLQEVPKYPIAYFKSWLYMVAKNHCLSHLRSSKGKLEVPVAIDELPATEMYDADDEAWAVPDSGAHLQAALQELSEAQSTCIKSFYIDKKSYQQIAAENSLSLLQVKSHIQNGKRNLKIIIEKKIKKQQQHGR